MTTTSDAVRAMPRTARAFCFPWAGGLMALGLLVGAPVFAVAVVRLGRVLPTAARRRVRIAAAVVTVAGVIPVVELVRFDRQTTVVVAWLAWIAMLVGALVAGSAAMALAVGTPLRRAWARAQLVLVALVALDIVRGPVDVVGRSYGHHWPHAIAVLLTVLGLAALLAWLCLQWLAWQRSRRWVEAWDRWLDPTGARRAATGVDRLARLLARPAAAPVRAPS